MGHVVVSLDGISREGLAPLVEDRAFEVTVLDRLDPARRKDQLAHAHALLVRSATKVDATLIADAPKLVAIGRAGAGVDNIDVPAATARGIAVYASPGGNSNAAAEHTIAMMLALARHVPQADAKLRAGTWERSAFTGTELRGKTLGIAGLGRIGRIVANVARALGMNLIAYDPVLPAGAFADAGAHRVGSFDELLAGCDWLTLHLPLIPETRNLLDAARIAKMKRGARIINVARGALVDERALHEALVSGHLGGAAIDVFPTEPCTSSPLFALPNVVVTPHLGASTHEAQIQVALDVARSVRAHLSEGGWQPEAVNAAKLGAAR